MAYDSPETNLSDEPELAVDLLQNILALPKRTGDTKYGVIDKARWNQDNKWLSTSQHVKPGFASNTTLWHPSI